MERKNKVALTFALYQNDALVRRETITQDIVKVGKDRNSHLRLSDEQAARMHAVIEVTSADEITLVDLGNDPGTAVNGARVNKAQVRPGDEIQIGGTRIVLERAEAVAIAAPPNPFAAGPNPFAAPATMAFADPFAAPAPPAATDVPADAPEGSYTYTLVKSTADVPAEEVEDARASSVEVMILWDTSVLHVQHLTPPRSFYVGEEQGKGVACDFFIPSEKLGTMRAPLLLADRGAVSLVLPAQATGTIEIAGQPKMTIRDAVEKGLTMPCGELSGAAQMPLPAGSKAKIEVGGLTFQIAAGNAGRAVAGHFQLDTQGLLYTGISLAVHAGLLAAMAFFMPPLGTTDEDGLSAEQTYQISQYLQAAAEKESQAREEEVTADNTPQDKSGGTGTRATGSEGAMGDQMSKATGMKYGVKGSKENPDPHIARQRALDDAGNFGIIGMLNSGAGGDPHAPTAPWGREDSQGNDPLSANGNMWGNGIGDSYGASGLGLSGIGEGGGGHGEGIGLGALGTLGHGSGLGGGDGFGNGFGHGHPRGTHQPKPPTMRVGETVASGHLPPEVIQRIVRQNFGRFRLCYENGLRNSPNLAGRVGVRFVIGRDGAVSNVGNGGSDLPDSAVVSCVVRAFYGLSFPAPDSGIVTVTYPIVFNPGTP
jgi:Inner membrane component of T3SS, cytoplasmic domain